MLKDIKNYNLEVFKNTEYL